MFWGWGRGWKEAKGLTFLLPALAFAWSLLLPNRRRCVRSLYPSTDNVKQYIIPKVLSSSWRFCIARNPMKSATIFATRSKIGCANQHADILRAEAWVLRFMSHRSERVVF